MPDLAAHAVETLRENGDRRLHSRPHEREPREVECRGRDGGEHMNRVGVADDRMHADGRTPARDAAPRQSRLKRTTGPPPRRAVRGSVVPRRIPRRSHRPTTV
jgi:hypothetical protein